MAGTNLRKRGLRITSAVAVLILSVGQTTFSQTVNAALHGTVTDSSGAVVPHATVSVQNLATKVTRQSETDDVGFYTVLQLPPGHYTITASKVGFSTSVRENVQVLVNEDLAVDFKLNVGAVSQKVEVTGAPTALETASATVAQVVGSQATVQLPLNGRQFTQLILLTPGAAPKENGQQAANFVPIGAGGITPAVDGQRPAQNNFTLDGGLNNYLQNNGWIISPPPDAIQEFRVQSHIVDAQFGISSGANVNVVTKSGSDQIHGDVWEFLRNDKFDAANFFTNFANQKKAPFRMNQYGVALGGPVILPGYNGREKKTYFFGYWEGFRSHQGFTTFANVPPAVNLAGDFSNILTTTKLNTDALGRPIFAGQIFNPYSTRSVTAGQVDAGTGLVATSSGLVRDPFTGNVIPQTMLNKAALTYLAAFYPKPNFGTGGFPNFAGPSLQMVTQDQFGTRIDHAFANNDNLSGAFYFRNSESVQPTALLLGAGFRRNNGRMLNLNYTHLFSPTFLATVHYQYTYTFFTGLSFVPAGLAVLNATDLADFLPVNFNEPVVPAVSLAPRLATTNQAFIFNGPDHTHLLTVDLQKIKGSHTLAAGVFFYRLHTLNIATSAQINFNQIPSGGIAASGANVSSGDGLASMLLNVPNSFTGQFGNTTADLTGVWQAYYLQDKWQATKRLNIQFGMRYDYVPPLHWANDQVSGFSLQCGCFLVSQPVPPLFPSANVRSTFFDPNYHGFEPRFGFAYTATPRTVVRGGFAIIDDHGNNLKQGTQALRIKWPWGASVNLAGFNVGTPNLFFDHMPAGSSFFGPGSAVVSGFGAEFHKAIPYSIEWNFGIQGEITPNLVADVDYIGSGSVHQDIYATANTPLPSLMGPGPIAPKTPFFVQFPSLGQVSYNMNEGTGNYNALQAKLERRFSAGITFLASYTWSHCFDIQGGVAAGAPETIYDIRRDYASCDANFPQLFSFSTVYQLPWGKGKRFGSNWSGPLNAVAGGWQASGVVTADSGSPFSVTVSGDIANVGGGMQRAQLVGNPLPSGFKQTVQEWFNKDAYKTPAAFTFGNLGRNTLLGPSIKAFDFSLMKDFHFTESKYLEFRSDFFNLLNNVNLGTPNGTRNSPSFMVITSAGSPRDIQFALKLVW